jgi:hypothetical protein
MAFADTANLIVKLSLGGNFESQLSKVTRQLKGFDKDATRGYKAGAQIGTGIKRGALLAAAGVGVLATQVGFGLDQLIELESLTAQTNAALKSTKGVAGQTAASIRTLAERYEGLNATIDDKVIQSGENVLLTFTNVRKQAFEPALAAALDLSVAMKQDLSTSVLQVGKALNDPVKGITALRRAGVQLSPVQEKQIKQFVKQGKTLDAQKVILKELNKEFGGSFLAGGQTTAGKVAKFGDAIEDLQKNLATALLPAVSNIADGLDKLFRDPATIKAVGDLGKDIGALFSPENISKGIGLLKDGFGALKAIAGPIASVVGTAVKAFTSLPPELQKALVGGVVVNKLTGGLVTNVFGGIADAIAKSFIKAPLVNVTGGVVNVGGGIPGGGGGLPSVPGAAAGGLGIAGLAQVASLAAVPLIPLVASYFLAGGEQGINSKDLSGRTSTATARGLNPANVPTKTTPGMQSAITAWAKGKDIKDASRADSHATLLVEQAARRTAEAVRSSQQVIAGKVANVGAAVRESRPIVTTNVKVSVSGNSVTKTIQVTGRYGQPNGSRNQGNIGVSGAR